MTMFTKKFLCAYSALYKKKSQNSICRLCTHGPRKINGLEIGCRGAEKKVFDFIETFFWDTLYNVYILHILCILVLASTAC